MHVQPEHLRTDQLLDRLYRSQRLQRELRRFLQRELRIGIELHTLRWSQRQRVLHGKLDVQHHVHGFMLGELFFGFDLQPQVPSGQLPTLDSSRWSLLTGR